MEEGHLLGSETPEPIQMKFGTFDYVHCLTPHSVAAAKGVGWEDRWSFTLACFFAFLVPRTHVQPSLRSVDYRSMHPKCILVVSAFVWGDFASV